jgi:type II secretory pathway pseudopilin PulG
MSIWIAVFAGFVALAIIAISMAGLFFLLTKATDKQRLLTESDSDESEIMHF